MSAFSDNNTAGANIVTEIGDNSKVATPPDGAVVPQDGAGDGGTLSKAGSISGLSMASACSSVTGKSASGIPTRIARPCAGHQKPTHAQQQPPTARE